MKKLLKLIGIGLISGATARAGSMWMDYLFPDGFGAFFARLRARNEHRSREDYRRNERDLIERG